MSRKKAEVSLVMPCYNEELSIRETVPELINAFTREDIGIQLVLVNNGSKDGTGRVLDEFVRAGQPIKKVDLEKNQGYGGGILRGLAECDSPVVGYLCADGQVAADDVLMAYRLIKGREDRTVTKVRRKFREDSWKRKLVSIIYNGLMQVLYGKLSSIDINGNPKLFSYSTMKALDLTSKDWFLDPELIIKAKYMGLRIIEVDVEGCARRGGSSNVRLATCAEFIKNIALYRIGRPLKDWKARIDASKYRVKGEPDRTPLDPQNLI